MSQQGAVAKLGIGTAQFGMPYGIANVRGRIPSPEVRDILAFAAENGIRLLDTASVYGESESVIGDILGTGQDAFDIVSKFGLGEVPVSDVPSLLAGSFLRLKTNYLYGYLIHQYSDFTMNPLVWNVLKDLKDKGQVGKIGFSLYRTEELDFLMEKKILPDILQVPYSIFDRRFEPYFLRLKDLGVEVHVRSIFLQGLIYLSSGKLPPYLKNVEASLNKLGEIAAGNSLTTGAICLNYVLGNHFVDNAVIGVDGLVQLKENIANIRHMDQVCFLNKELAEVEIRDENILLPYKWEK
ncbi:MAG: aldo/keto reductase [Candidatus Omnitrophica bacterium]|nr:aldo/keto reductase [Candidatus Omnitrophota bacterium]